MMTPRSILIVEDDPALLRGLTDNFVAAGYDVRVARDGREGLQKLFSAPPDLLLLDLMLPHVNGYTVCETARAKKLTLPIIMITAKGQEDDIVRGLDCGADDYVTKPFGIRPLLARVKAFLRRQEADPSAYSFGPYKLDLTAHRLWRGPAEVELTSKEFKLLEFFAQRSGRALTRQMILDGVWGSDIFVTERSVDRCVTTLRGKIEKDSRHPVFIQTLRDVGYRFEVG